MKRLFLLLSVILLVSGCYDDSALWESVNDHESRISKLEKLCTEMNTNISSIKTIVEALQKNDYVTSVTPVTEDGKEIGYTITFSKSASITIYHGKDGADGEDGTDGKDGADGQTPVIGVRQDAEGVYYWTLNGEWLLDDSGNKIPTTGKDGADGEDGQDGAPGQDGKDGITPQLKIEDGYWYVSYDNGASWTEVGKATGNQGPQGNPDVGGDSMFTDIDYSSSDEYVIFILSNGARIQIPTWYAFESLKVQCEQMNSNIEALQTVVEVLQNNDYVTDIIPVVENGKEVGYIIKFGKSGSVTIYHGKDGADGEDGTDGNDGADGQTPVIGVRQDAEGVYYWTLNGEWLLDDSGNKIPTTGKDGADGEDGQDGITPELKIEDGYWYVSYDNGASWTEVGKAVGENGKDGEDGADGDSFFRSVTQDDANVYFTLADGTVITLPKKVSLSIEFDSEDLVVMAPNSTRDIRYTVTSVLPDVEVEALSSGDVQAKVVPDEAGESTGVIRVRIPGDSIDEYCKVVVLVSNGEKVIMRTLTFEEEAIEVVDEAKVTANAEGGEVELLYLSNVECEVVIPEDAKSWISVAPATKVLQQRSVSLVLQPNTEYYRSATVTIKAIDGSLALEYVIEQDGDLGVKIDPTQIPDNEIWYVTNNNKLFDFSKYPDFTDAKIVSHTYDKMGVIKFDKTITEIRRAAFATGVGYEDGFFISRDNYVESVFLPNTIEEIHQNAFMGNSLKVFHTPKNLRFVGSTVFGMSYDNENITFIGEHATDDGRCIIIDDILYVAAFIEGAYVIPSGVTKIADLAFCKCFELEHITFPEGLTYIGYGAFMGCTKIEGEIYFPQSVEYIGERAFTDASNITRFYGHTHFTSPNELFLIQNNAIVAFAKATTNIDIVIPEGINSIGFNVFSDCINISSITFPSSMQSISPDSFERCYNLEYIYGDYASKDNKCYVYNNTLLLFAGKNVKNYITPDNVNCIGWKAFSWMPDLETITLSDNVTSVYAYGYIFDYSENLKEITISANMKYLGYDPFGTRVQDNLETVYLRTRIPPIIEHNRPENIPSLFPNLTIYVPEQSLQAYLGSPDWAPYRGYIKGYNYTDLPENDTYISTDYSTDGDVTTLQTATKGDGIDIVLMGDAYSDRQIADGTYKADMEYIYNNLFTEEPYRSFKDYFNVHYVNVVSATEGYEYGNTALDTFFGDGTYVGGSDNACFEYALNAISENDMDEALIIVAMNSDNYAGTCYMYYPTYATGTYGSGPSVAYFPKGGDQETFAQLLHHEACGHGFAKLADEYAYEDMGTVPGDYAAQTARQQNEWGWWKNVDFTNDPSQVRWSYFLEDERYQYDGLGCFEGGLTYWNGVWRPTENSIMRYNTGGFNAPSREAIYYRIHKLAYGDSWEYDYEDFVEYDAVNRASSASAPQKSRGNYVERTFEPTAPPVVVNKSWREAK